MPGSPTTPLLSLCLATYNRARYLDRYLTHHLGGLDAAGIDYELVVSDNCSTDETPQILARYAAEHPRMRVSSTSSPPSNGCATISRTSAATPGMSPSSANPAVA